jgi:hypothetical protein
VGSRQVPGVLCESRLVSLKECGCHILRLEWLFIDAAFVSITHDLLSLSLSSPRAVTPCPPSLPRLPPIPTLPPFSTLPWINTIVRLGETSPSIRSFPGFNPVIPPKLSSPSFESKTPSSINPRIATMDSRIGLPRQ